MPNLSRTLADHIASARYEQIPLAAIEAAKKSLLDALGVTLGASGMGEGCGAFVDLARAAGGGDASIIGYDERAPASLAALANGAMAHALDFEDAYDGAPLHPNAAVIPAALAAAQMRGGVDGRALLTAIAVGCDLACRIGLCLKTPMENFGWYPPPMFSAFGATAAAANILGLSAEQVVDAFSLTLCQTVCSGEIKYSAQSHIRAVRDGFAAQAGVLSADLARRGVRGFEAPFEGKAGFFALYAAGDYDAAVLTGDLGVRFFGEDVSFKFWPSCRGTHAFIEAALALRGEGVAAEDIEHLDLGGIPMLTMLVEPQAQKRAPATAIDAKFSLPFTVATAFVDGAVTLDSFSPQARAAPKVLALAARTGFAPRSDWGPDKTAGGVLAATLRDGRVLKREIAHAFGHPNNPMGRDALIDKFHQCADRAAHPWGAERRARVIAALFALEGEPDAPRALLSAQG